MCVIDINVRKGVMSMLAIERQHSTSNNFGSWIFELENSGQFKLPREPLH